MGWLVEIGGAIDVVYIAAFVSTFLLLGITTRW